MIDVGECMSKYTEGGRLSELVTSVIGKVAFLVWIFCIYEFKMSVSV